MSAARRLSAKTFAALSVRNFRLFFVGQLISVSGTWMQSVAQGWLVLQLTGSSVDLGIAIALQFVPILLLGTYGGLIADRHEKRRILYVTQSAAGLLALTLGLLMTTHHVNVDTVYALALALGVVNLFDVPARQAFVQEMVGRDLIANAVSLNSVLMNSGRVIGPSVAAATIALVGTAACFYANAASYVAVLVALAMMRASDLLPMATVERERGQLRLGLRYVAREPLLRNVVVAVAVVGTFAFNFTVTIPLLAHVTFHQRSATQYGLLMGSMGLGAIVGGLAVAHRARPTPRMLVGLAVAFGASMVLVAVAPTLLVAELALVPTGAFGIALLSTANSTLQLHSSEEMRGRVMSLYTTAFQGTTPIGAPLLGVLVSITNPRVAFLAGGVMVVATGLGLLVTLRQNNRSSDVLAAMAESMEGAGGFAPA